MNEKNAFMNLLLLSPLVHKRLRNAYRQQNVITYSQMAESEMDTETARAMAKLA